LNRLFIERIPPGITVHEVEQRMPLADTVEYLVWKDRTTLVQRYAYNLPLGSDYHVNVLYDSGVVSDVEVSEDWLRNLRPIDYREVPRRLPGVGEVRNR
jgi:hypothetical protein